MRQSRKEVGYGGIALIGIGIVLTLIGAVVAGSNPGIGMLLVFAGISVYVPGGFLAVSHYGYSRGSKLYLLISMSRGLIAVGAVSAFVRSFGGPF